MAECLLTLAELAHPAWGLHPTAFEMQKCLLQAIEGLDPDPRALINQGHLSGYENRQQAFPVSKQVTSDLRERITYLAGTRFDLLKSWLETYQSGEPLELDYFISRLFGELLSQPGFGFHRDPSAGTTAANLVESIRKFRSVLIASGDYAQPLGPEYIRMVKAGILAAQYLQDWNERRAGCSLDLSRLHLPDAQPGGRRSILAGCRQPGLVGTALPAADPPVRVEPQLADGRQMDRCRMNST